MTKIGSTEGSGTSHWKGDVARFLGAGAFNTLLTLGIYQGLLFFCRPAVAYAVAWSCGLLFVAIFYPRKVFRTIERGVPAGVAAAVVYLLGFVLGLFIVTTVSSEWSLPRLGIFVSIVVTTIFNFVVMRSVLGRMGNKKNDVQQ